MTDKRPKPPFTHILLIVISLILAIATIYLQTEDHQFLSYDDDIYITSNQNIQDGLTTTSIKQAFTSTYESNYIPLTWLSHMLDVHLFGLDPGNHHLVNVFFHALNTLLVFLLLRLMTSTLWRSAMVAALFACHPLHVESVAWIAERKDLLSTFFGFLTIFGYHYYLKRRSLRRYILIIICFVASLLSKPMLVTLPFALLLLDYWPYDRFKFDKESAAKLIIEKIPLFFLSIISCVIAYYAQLKGSSVVSLTNFDLMDRVSNGIVSYVNYLNKTIWPVNLSVFYPYPESIHIIETAGACLILALISYFFIKRIKERPYLIVGWLWFLGTLVPVIGLVQIGEQAMADRYTYVPLLGIFIILVWGTKGFLANLQGWKHKQKFIVITAIAVLVTCIAISYRQTSYWQNDKELFGHAIKVTQNNHLAQFQLGTAYARTGEFDKAERHLRDTIKIKPGTSQAYNNLAYVLERKGNITEAIINYQKSANLDPNNKDAHYNLGLIYLRRWELKKAIDHLQRVLEISPTSARARKNLVKARKLLQGQRERMNQKSQQKRTLLREN